MIGDGTQADPEDPNMAEQNGYLPSGAAAAWRIRFRLPADAMVTGTNPLLLLDELRKLGPTSVAALTEDVPPLEDIDPGLSYLRWEVVVRTTQPRSAIEQVFLFVLDEMELAIDRLMMEANVAPEYTARGDTAGAGRTRAASRRPSVTASRDRCLSPTNARRRPAQSPEASTPSAFRPSGSTN